MSRHFCSSSALLALLFTLGCGPSHQQALLSTPVPPSPTTAKVLPGKKQDGSVLLPNQWSLRPVGDQVELADFPVNIALHPSGKYAAVLHAGYGQHQVVVVDVGAQKVVSRTPIKETFYGVEFSANGKKLFCSGAGEETVHAFDFNEGALSGEAILRLRDAAKTGVPAGLAVNSAGTRLYVCNLRGDSISIYSMDGADSARVVDIAVGGPGGRAGAKPSENEDVAAVEKRAQAEEDEPTGESFPYACRLDERAQRLYVSLWGQSSVAVVDLHQNKVLTTWPTGQHPCEMVLTRNGTRLFVANANHNTVTVIDTRSGRSLETLWAALHPRTPPGSTPNSLALSPDEKLLFVANANDNTIAVLDVSQPGKSRSLGFIPSGWYPTSVRVTPDGRQLLIANGKGLASAPNPLGPTPGVRRTNTVEYIAGLFKGSLGIVPLPRGSKLEQQLPRWTAIATACSPLASDGRVTAERAPNNPVPLAPGNESPIKYCIYIIKENRTYDQIFGDMPEGNGDPNLCLFPETVTPNHHRLAREFVLLDNFYVESEVSADGHEWSMGAYATDFVEKLWPMGYGHDSSGKFPYASEGNFAIATPAGGYLWDRAREAGVSYRSYGEFTTTGSETRPARAKAKALEGHIDPLFRGYDLGYPDVKRADRIISELKRFEQEGDMPRLQIMRLPNDHTRGASVGAPTPRAYLADNDLALGRVVEAFSRSKFWPNLAIFVVEDDAQNGPDHVDAHRTVAFVISPYVKRGSVDSSLYSTSSMLRTMELILGLKPMSRFDAAARPMYNSFQAAPDLRPYTALPANIDLNEKSTRQAWGSDLRFNFAKEDAADDLLLNEVIWRSVKGADSPAPAPVRAAFVFSPEKDADGD